MSIFQRMSELATCLCAQIIEDGNGETCFCGVIPGDSAAGDLAGDGCDGGMAWVRLISAYPSQTVGQASVMVGNCASGMGYDIEVGILRPTTLGADEGVPDSADVLATAELQMADMQTMLKAILCCPAFPTKDVIIGTYRPLGPLGLLVGGAWPIYTAI